MSRDTTTLAERLLACPFCGGNDVREDYNLRTEHDEVFCDDCGAKVTEDKDTGTSAIDAWNRRAHLDHTAAQGVTERLDATLKLEAIGGGNSKYAQGRRDLARELLPLLNDIIRGSDGDAG